MSFQEVPKGLRLHIALIGRRNVGKSSLLNALAGQDVSIVSPTAGTTTDPVEKVMELAPIGPVVLMDTAGMDDEGELGLMRSQRSRQVLARTEVALLVTDAARWGDEEEGIATRLLELKIPFAVVRNKCDLQRAPSARPASLDDSVPVVDISALQNDGIDKVREVLASLAPRQEAPTFPLLADLLPPHGVVVLVTPIDSGAPKGRLILPQVQAIRDSLDHGMVSMVVTERELPLALARLAQAPDLVVCDSQVVHTVAATVDPGIAMTTFSILMARFKGDLASLARGAAALARIVPGDAILIQEACSHHPQQDDIGRVKLPRLLQKIAGGELDFCWSSGKEWHEYDKDFKAIVHCGACVITRGQMLARLRAAQGGNIPMTNYGLAISLAQGVLERVLSPFPAALDDFRRFSARA